MGHSIPTMNPALVYPSILREEYQTLVAEIGLGARDEALIGALVTEADWTEQGGEEVLRLAREYGTSVLRNALALAEALRIEDGSRGL